MKQFFLYLILGWRRDLTGRRHEGPLWKEHPSLAAWIATWVLTVGIVWALVAIALGFYSLTQPDPVVIP